MLRESINKEKHVFIGIVINALLGYAVVLPMFALLRRVV